MSKHWKQLPGLLLTLIWATQSPAQLEPGPYEYLPFQEAFILEAFYDLDSGSLRADWTGWQGSSWESPNAYNGHRGTDFSLQTGTPVYAPCDGQIVSVTNHIPENNHGIGDGYGNNVKIKHDLVAYANKTLYTRLAHLLPNVQVSVGEQVSAGQLIGYSDNTGNSTSEHLHFQSEFSATETRCPFYWGLWKYPIMFNPEQTFQLGHIVRVYAPSATVHAQRYQSSTVVTTVHQDQLYYAPYWRRGHYLIMLSNHNDYRSGWISAQDVQEVFYGTVLQVLPDTDVYAHTEQLHNPLPILATPQESADTVDQVIWGGGRYVADSTRSGMYRIPIPGENPTWGWIRSGEQMIVYSELFNQEVNLHNRREFQFPLIDSFMVGGPTLPWRPKFSWGEIRLFDSSNQKGDGHAFFMYDDNVDHARHESMIIGNVHDRNYYVEAEVYFNYKPELASNGFERYGILMRDDGFAGVDMTFEGKGNCYAMLYDSDDGRLRAARVLNASITDFCSPSRYVKDSGWHRLRIEAFEEDLFFYLDEELLAHMSDDNFPSGPSGLGYSDHFNDPPSDRGAYFDNFKADTLLSSPARIIIGDGQPERYQLLRCFPNPFNSQLTIQLDMVNPEQGFLKICNLQGSLVQELKIQPGIRRYFWDAHDLHNTQVASGIYFLILESPDFTKIQKLILLK